VKNSQRNTLKMTHEQRIRLKEILEKGIYSADSAAELMKVFEEVSPGILNSAARTSHRKRHIDRMMPFFKTVSELAQTEQLLPPGSDEERRNSFKEILNHTASLVEEAGVLYKADRYSRAGFLSITAVEEIGKCAVARVQVVTGVPANGRPFSVGRSGALMSHKKKYILAACAGAVINHRMDELFGIDAVNGFIEDCETGKLVTERESYLYYGFDGTLHIPDLEVVPKRISFLISVAAELFSEGGTQELDDWETSRRPPLSR